MRRKKTSQVETGETKPEKMPRKVYEKELERLHGELVSLQ